MPRIAIHPSASLAALLRDARRERGLTLRQVEKQTAHLGEAISYSTLARVEQGKIDPGVRRLHVLLRLYGVPLQLAGDLLDLELLGPAVPRASADQLHSAAIELWQKGDTRAALAHLLALRRAVPSGEKNLLARQRALLSFAVTAGSFGKRHLAKEIVDNLLAEPPHATLLVRVLVQAAVCWHWVGGKQASLAFIEHADRLVAADAFQEQAWIAHHRASTLVDLGSLEGVRASIDRARTAYRSAGDPWGESKLLATEFKLAMAARDPARALDLAREAVRHAKEHGFERLLTLRLVDEGHALLASGRAAEAVRTLELAVARAAQHDDPMARFYAHYYGWKASTRLGDVQRAALELQSAQYFLRFLDEISPESQDVRASGKAR